jgi:hypothetical protein
VKQVKLYCQLTLFCKYLKAFIQFVTGSPVVIAKIAVTFDDNADAETISANTCGRHLMLSTALQDMFVAAMTAVVPFTMP